MHLRNVVAMACLALSTTACNLQKMAIRQMTPMLPEGIVAFEEESDYEFARDALAGQLKFLETLERNDQTNARLRVLLAQGYASYGFLFLEDEAQAIEIENPGTSDAATARARVFYARARDFALGELKRRKGFEQALAQGVGDEGIAALRAHLKGYDKDDVALLFWTAYAWGSYVNMSRDDIEAVADQPRADALMERVLELDPSYYNAGAHLYFALANAAKPEALGGKPQESLKHFQEASRLTDGKFLMTDVFWARAYAVQVQDRELFLAKLKHVLDAPADLNPRQALANVLAKRKAARYLKHVDEYF
jgi:TRAP transporter TatT component family protein